MIDRQFWGVRVRESGLAGQTILRAESIDGRWVAEVFQTTWGEWRANILDADDEFVGSVGDDNSGFTTVDATFQAAQALAEGLAARESE